MKESQSVASSAILFRPVGPEELQLIADLQFQAFPPRLPEQPIFYPVLNFEYAEQIARDWNAKGKAQAGFVCRFRVDAQFVARYEVQTVGGGQHQELWVPADELEDFNRRIVAPIEIVASYYGDRYAGSIDPGFRLPIDVADKARKLGLPNRAASQKTVRKSNQAYQIEPN